MAVYDIIPTNNVKFDDIRDTLNSKGGSVTNDTRTAFKTNSGIDKWSKKKPVRLQVDFCQDFNSGLPNYYPNWWKAYDGNCGMTIPIYTSMGDSSQGFIHDIINKNFAWTYTPPTGTSAQPMRLGDFLGYNRNAINPISEPLEKITAYKDIDGYLNFNFDMAVAPNHPSNLTLQDIAVNGVTLDNYYLGMIMWRTTGLSTIIATSTNKIGTSELSMKFKPAIVGGAYKAALFVSSVVIDPNGNVPSGKFIPLELRQFNLQVNDYGTTIKIVPTADWNGTNRVDYSIAVQNLNSGQFTVRNIVAVIIQGNTASTGQVLKTIQLGDKTVKASSVEYITGSVTGLSYSSSNKYWIGAYADNIAATYNQISL